MKTDFRIWVLVFMGLLLISVPAQADQVHLVNGDVITGKLIRMENRKLLFKTEYAGDISLDWGKIVKLITEESIEVILSDGTTLEGFTREPAPNKMILEAERLEAPAEFKLADVEAVNPVKKPSVRIKVSANAGLSRERGNTDTDTAHLDAEFTARTEKNRYSLGGELNNEKDKGDTTSKNWLAYGNYSHFLTEKWFFYSVANFEHDKFADLELRSTLGVGAGYQFFESDDLNLFVSAGPGYVNEDYIEAEDNNFAVGQWLINYDQYFFGRAFQLFHNQQGYTQMTTPGNWLIKTRQGVRIPIYKGFTATLQYNYDYDNDPSDEADKKWDSKLMFLLGWQFGN